LVVMNVSCTARAPTTDGDLPAIYSGRCTIFK
jgi:hypothetical protein